MYFCSVFIETNTMNTSKLFHKNTLLFLIIFIIGIIGFAIYINATFEEENPNHTSTPFSQERVSYHS
nr:hypothetical protein [uncultured bacterium]